MGCVIHTQSTFKRYINKIFTIINMVFSIILLLSTFTGSNGFFEKSHDIQTHSDGSLHMFENSQHRRLSKTKHLKANSDTTNTKFTVHGSQYITNRLHVDGSVTCGGFGFASSSNTFNANALNSLAGDGITIVNDALTVPSAASLTDYDTKADAALAVTTAINNALTDYDTSAVVATALANGLTVANAATDAASASADTALNNALNAYDTSAVAKTAVATALTNYVTTASADAATASADAAVTTADALHYRLENMILLLCNTLGIKYGFLTREVDSASFNPYARFGAIQVDKDLYAQGASPIGTTTLPQLCADPTLTAAWTTCSPGFSNKHDLAYCAADSCDSSDFGSGVCCIADKFPECTASATAMTAQCTCVTGASGDAAVGAFCSDASGTRTLLTPTACAGTTDGGGGTNRDQVTAATATADRTCTACAANFFAAVGDNSDCAAVTACFGTTDGGTTARTTVTAATTTANTICTPCAGNFFAAGNSNCAAWALAVALGCGNTDATGTTSRYTAGSTTVDASCAACGAGTVGANDAANCQ